MELNYILENVELSKLLNNSIGKTYNKYHLSFIIDLEDFRQECYIYLMKRLKNFDSEKSTIRTYLPIIIMSCARECIRFANGQSTKHNKLDFNNNIVSLEDELKNAENINARIEDETTSSDSDYFNKVLIDEIINIKTLSDNQKVIIKLMSKGYSITDVANILHKTPSCINITFQRAKEKIVKKYAL